MRGYLDPAVDFDIFLETALSKSCIHSLGMVGYMVGGVRVAVIILGMIGGGADVEF